MPFPIEKKYVVETETQLGRTFPSWYRIKMMSENGGQFEALGDMWDLYPVWNKANKKVMKRTANDIIQNTESAREWLTFPDEAVAIAQNGTGDLLLLLPKDDKYFSDLTYHWDHETGSVTRVKYK